MYIFLKDHNFGGVFFALRISSELSGVKYGGGEKLYRFGLFKFVILKKYVLYTRFWM